MTYDLIIVTKSSTPQLQQVTQNCINSARSDCDLNVIIVETGRKFNYEGASMIIEYEDQFNYNKALNKGLEFATGDVHILANNDLYFHPGWSEIGELMLLNNFDSASALSNDGRQRGFERGDFIYEGYSIGTHISGWCIFITKEAVKRIGKLDETFVFWYSDNVYAEQLKLSGLRHGLFCNVQVDHIGSMTLRTLPYTVQRQYSFRSRRNVG